MAPAVWMFPGLSPAPPRQSFLDALGPPPAPGGAARRHALATLGLLAGFVALLFAAAALAGMAMAPVNAARDRGLLPVWSGEVAMAVALLAGAFGLVLIAVVQWRVRGERLRAASLFTGVARFRWDLLLASFAVSALAVTASAVAHPQAAALMEQRGVLLGPVALTGLALALLGGFAIQSTAEEVLVRGWLMQRLRRQGLGLAACIGVSSVVFALLHLQPGIGWGYVVAIGLTGVALAWSAVRANGLEACIGLHVGNNFSIGALFGAFTPGAFEQGNVELALSAAIYGLGFAGFLELWFRFGPGRAPRA